MKKYLGEYYPTKLSAEKALASWRRKQYKEIEKRKDIVLSDNSYVYKKFMWSNSETLDYSYETNVQKWVIMRLIWTQQMVNDLSRYRNVDAEAELAALLKDRMGLDN
jgi:hypothetical protein